MLFFLYVIKWLFLAITYIRRKVSTPSPHPHWNSVGTGPSLLQKFRGDRPFFAPVWTRDPTNCVNTSLQYHLEALSASRAHSRISLASASGNPFGQYVKVDGSTSIPWGQTLLCSGREFRGDRPFFAPVGTRDPTNCVNTSLQYHLEALSASRAHSRISLASASGNPFGQYVKVDGSTSNRKPSQTHA